MSKLPETQCRALLVSPEDNVATLLAPAATGATVSIQGAPEGRAVTVASDIPFGHKVALVDIAQGEQIIKYGQRIGRATADIPLGGHAHVHNVVGERGRKDKQRLDDDQDGIVAGGGDHC